MFISDITFKPTVILSEGEQLKITKLIPLANCTATEIYFDFTSNKVTFEELGDLKLSLESILNNIKARKEVKTILSDRINEEVFDALDDDEAEQARKILDSYQSLLEAGVIKHL